MPNNLCLLPGDTHLCVGTVVRDVSHDNSLDGRHQRHDSPGKLGGRCPLLLGSISRLERGVLLGRTLLGEQSKPLVASLPFLV